MPTAEHENAAPIPRYRCHKEVYALKLASVEQGPGQGRLVPADARYSPLLVTQQYMDKHKPEAGGYFVQYEDGYQSFSPAKAFEEGYTLIDD